MTSTKDLGYDGYYTRTLPSKPRQSPIKARNNTPPGALGLTHLNSPLNPTTDITFSSTDSDTAAWTEGTIYFGDGSATDLLPAGNTGDITATTFIYYDKNKPGELRTTTTPQNATGPTRVMMAIVDQGNTGKDCKIVTALGSGLTVSGITANQIAANTIISGNVDSSIIDRLFTDSSTKTNIEAWKSASDVTKIDGGNIYAGSSVVIGSSGLIRSGQTDYNTGSGWWIGDVSGTPKMSIGEDSASRMLWTGNDLQIYDKNNTKILDSDGIQSPNVFPANGDTFNIVESTTSTSNVDVSTVYFTFEVPKTMQILYFVTIDGYGSKVDEDATFRTGHGWYDWDTSSYTWFNYTHIGHAYGSHASLDETSPDVVRETISKTYLITHNYHDPGENPPTHKVKLQFKSSDSGSTAYCYYVNMGYVKLGA